MDAAMVSPALKPMTADEYFERPETMQPEQLLDGELIVTAPTSEHQYALASLHLLLAPRVPGGRVYLSPTDVWLDELNVTQPDLFWIAENSRSINRKGRFYGPPELVVEILSPSTARYDCVIKFQLYERHGVPEYWIVDLDARTVEVWQLVDALYQRVGIYLPGAALTSPVLGGKTIETASIFPPA
jgi:Uma2 family endonuclease